MCDRHSYVQVLAVHLHTNSKGKWYVVVTERDEQSGHVRTRHAMKNGGRLEFDPFDEQPLVFDEYR